ncbi:hypothetical protein J1N35_019738 [Gossypium stocksii]|uniref:Uncharacterized protein n=1 Tax=Gossypium stocksii TaxID=47602 RepID=A0A9D3VCP9_9ROSI|nr:hypothetical protein J1N35_019738 [Gossypium stocksii]
MTVNLLERRGSRFILRLLFPVWISHGGRHRVPMGVEVPFGLSRVLYRQRTLNRIMILAKMGSPWFKFKVDFDRLVKLEETIKANCSRELVFYKR